MEMTEISCASTEQPSASPVPPPAPPSASSPLPPPPSSPPILAAPPTVAPAVSLAAAPALKVVARARGLMPKGCRCRGVCRCRRRVRERRSALARRVLSLLEGGSGGTAALMASALLAVRASTSPLAATRLLLAVTSPDALPSLATHAAGTNGADVA